MSSSLWTIVLLLSILIDVKGQALVSVLSAEVSSPYSVAFSYNVSNACPVCDAYYMLTLAGSSPTPSEVRVGIGVLTTAVPEANICSGILHATTNSSAVFAFTLCAIEPSQSYELWMSGDNNGAGGSVQFGAVPSISFTAPPPSLTFTSGSSPCASVDPSLTFTYNSPAMVQCLGSVTWANRETLCGAGWSACSPDQYMTFKGDTMPYVVAWNDFDAHYSGSNNQYGTATSVCSATESSTLSDCVMRICPNYDGYDDPLGGRCNWRNCLEVHDSNGAIVYDYGGCAGNNYASTQCCLDSSTETSCDFVDCGPHGLCYHDASGIAHCLCTDSYSGPYCRIRPSCDTSSCISGQGLCHASTGECFCLPGFTGTDCGSSLPQTVEGMNLESTNTYNSDVRSPSINGFDFSYQVSSGSLNTVIFYSAIELPSTLSNADDVRLGTLSTCAGDFSWESDLQTSKQVSCSLDASAWYNLYVSVATDISGTSEIMYGPILFQVPDASITAGIVSQIVPNIDFSYTPSGGSHDCVIFYSISDVFSSPSLVSDIRQGTAAIASDCFGSASWSGNTQSEFLSRECSELLASSSYMIYLSIAADSSGLGETQSLNPITFTTPDLSTYLAGYNQVYYATTEQSINLEVLHSWGTWIDYPYAMVGLIPISSSCGSAQILQAQSITETGLADGFNMTGESDSFHICICDPHLAHTPNSCNMTVPSDWTNCSSGTLTYSLALDIEFEAHQIYTANSIQYLNFTALHGLDPGLDFVGLIPASGTCGDESMVQSVAFTLEQFVVFNMSASGQVNVCICDATLANVPYSCDNSIPSDWKDPTGGLFGWDQELLLSIEPFQVYYNDAVFNLQSSITGLNSGDEIARFSNDPLVCGVGSGSYTIDNSVILGDDTFILCACDRTLIDVPCDLLDATHWHHAYKTSGVVRRGFEVAILDQQVFAVAGSQNFFIANLIGFNVSEDQFGLIPDDHDCGSTWIRYIGDTSSVESQDVVLFDLERVNETNVDLALKICICDATQARLAFSCQASSPSDWKDPVPGPQLVWLDLDIEMHKVQSFLPHSNQSILMSRFIGVDSDLDRLVLFHLDHNRTRTCGNSTVNEMYDVILRLDAWGSVLVNMTNRSGNYLICVCDATQANNFEVCDPDIKTDWEDPSSGLSYFSEYNIDVSLCCASSRTIRISWEYQYLQPDCNFSHWLIQDQDSIIPFNCEPGLLSDPSVRNCTAMRLEYGTYYTFSVTPVCHDLTWFPSTLSATNLTTRPCPHCQPILACTTQGFASDYQVATGECCSFGFTDSDTSYTASASYCDVCLSGFYGVSCDLCTCDQGDCYDGILNDGSCSCHPGFDGVNCDDCAPGRYGSDCSNVCTCVQGSCNDGKTGDGSCACNSNWDGVDCDECIPYAYGADCLGVCPPCTSNGFCDDGASGTGECICYDPALWAGDLCDNFTLTDLFVPDYQVSLDEDQSINVTLLVPTQLESIISDLSILFTDLPDQGTLWQVSTSSNTQPAQIISITNNNLKVYSDSTFLVRYTPDQDIASETVPLPIAADSFSYHIWNNQTKSTLNVPTTVSLIIHPQNDSPTWNPNPDTLTAQFEFDVFMYEDFVHSMYLSADVYAVDVDSTSVDLMVNRLPQSGTLYSISENSLLALPINRFTTHNTSSDGYLLYRPDQDQSNDPSSGVNVKDKAAGGEEPFDTFTLSFIDSEGARSGERTVSIWVQAIADAPVAVDQTFQASTNFTLIVLEVADADSLSPSHLTAQIEELPENECGYLYEFVDNEESPLDQLVSGASLESENLGSPILSVPFLLDNKMLVFQPVSFETDSSLCVIRFSGDDGILVSQDFGEITAIIPAREVPVGQSITVFGQEDDINDIILSGTVENDLPIKFAVVQSLPAVGTLYYYSKRAEDWLEIEDVPLPLTATQEQVVLRFRGEPDESGGSYASFTYDVGNGVAFSEVGYPVLIHLAPVNDPPVTYSWYNSTVNGDPVEVTLTSSDVDDSDSSLLFSILSIPEKGRLYGPDGNLVTGPTDYGSIGSGAIIRLEPINSVFAYQMSLTFAFSDGDLSSNEGEVMLLVIFGDGNVPPECLNMTMVVAEDSHSVVDLECEDVDPISSDAVLEVTANLPSSGSLYQVAADGQTKTDEFLIFNTVQNLDTRVIYIPPADAFSANLDMPLAEFTFYATDTLAGKSFLSWITIIVTPVNDAPLTPDVLLIGYEDQPMNLRIGASDIDTEGNCLNVFFPYEPPLESHAGQLYMCVSNATRKEWINNSSLIDTCAEPTTVKPILDLTTFMSIQSYPMHELFSDSIDIGTFKQEHVDSSQIAAVSFPFVPMDEFRNQSWSCQEISGHYTLPSVCLGPNSNASQCRIILSPPTHFHSSSDVFDALNVDAASGLSVAYGVDDRALSSLGQIAVEIVARNDAPYVPEVSYKNVTEEVQTQLRIDLADVDTDDYSNFLVLITELPLHGTLRHRLSNGDAGKTIIDGDEIQYSSFIQGYYLWYVSDRDFYGIDIFQYKVLDPEFAVSNIGAIHVYVAPYNDNPVSYNDHAWGFEDKSVLLYLYSDDVDSKDDILEFFITEPSKSDSGTLYFPTQPCNTTGYSALFSSIRNGTSFQPSDATKYSYVEAPSNTSQYPFYLGNLPRSCPVIFNPADDQHGFSVTGAISDGSVCNGDKFDTVDFIFDQVQFQTTDDYGFVSNIATIVVHVCPTDDLPISFSGQWVGLEDTAVFITLTGFDMDLRTNPDQTVDIEVVVLPTVTVNGSLYQLAITDSDIQNELTDGTEVGSYIGTSASGIVLNNYRLLGDGFVEATIIYIGDFDKYQLDFEPNITNLNTSRPFDSFLFQWRGGTAPGLDYAFSENSTVEIWIEGVDDRPRSFPQAQYYLEPHRGAGIILLEGNSQVEVAESILIDLGAYDVDDVEDLLEITFSSLPSRGKVYTSVSPNALNTSEIPSSVVDPRIYRLVTSIDDPLSDYILLVPSNNGGGVGETIFTTLRLSANDQYTQPLNFEIVVNVLCPHTSYINFWSTIGELCSSCPDGAYCSETGSHTPRAKPGYYLTQTSPEWIFVACFPITACSGYQSADMFESSVSDSLTNVSSVNASSSLAYTSTFVAANSLCSSGYSGYLCSGCETNYKRVGSECVECISDYAVLALFAVVIFVGFGFLLWLIERFDVDLAMIGIFLSFTQTVALFEKVSLDWRSSSTSMMAFFGMFSLNPNSLSVECDSTFIERYYAVFVIPFAVAGMGGLCLVLYRLYLVTLVRDGVGSKLFYQRVFQQKKRKMLAYLHFVFFVLYLPLCTAALTIFDCVERDDGSLVLRSEASIDCESDWYQARMPFHLAAFLIFALVLPCFWMSRIRRGIYLKRRVDLARVDSSLYHWNATQHDVHRLERLKTSMRTATEVTTLSTMQMFPAFARYKLVRIARRSQYNLFREEFYMLIDAFRPQHSGWFIAVALRKLSMVVVVLICGDYPVYSAAAILIILAIALAWQMQVNPYRSTHEMLEDPNLMEQVQLGLSMNILYLALVFYGDRHGFSEDETSSQAETNDTILGVLTILSTVAIFLLLLRAKFHRRIPKRIRQWICYYKSLKPVNEVGSVTTKSVLSRQKTKFATSPVSFSIRKQPRDTELTGVDNEVSATFTDSTRIGFESNKGSTLVSTGEEHWSVTFDSEDHEFLSSEDEEVARTQLRSKLPPKPVILKSNTIKLPSLPVIPMIMDDLDGVFESSDEQFLSSSGDERFLSSSDGDDDDDKRDDMKTRQLI